jgi:serine/threonine-protein kinase
VSVFEYVQQKDSAFRDISDRVERAKEASNSYVMSTAATANLGSTLILENSGVQKPMLGRYTIEHELGRGAMGMVYLGRDPKIGRTVAIKTMVLAQEFEGEKLQEVKERFFREAETAGRLNHPNIVTIYDVGEDEDLSYIAMDYLKGENLLAYCKSENLLPTKEVFECVLKVSNALEYAHQNGVIHRDVKPANIIYDRDTSVLKVTDFGVACLTDSSKTKTGTILGSPSYMSPEQLAGLKVDGRSDLFSLGVTLYQMLTGELPFIGESLASLMYKIANEKHPDVRLFRPDLPACVSRIINKALAKDAAKRFDSGERFSSAIERCLERL